MEPYRLPLALIPINYDLYLKPDLINGKFTGKVIANLKVLNDTNEIIFNAKDLIITSVLINREEAEFETDVKYEKLIIKKNINSTLEKTIYVTIEYEKTMDKIIGFYRSSYLNHEKKTRYIATSKFEPTYARLAFPCFDEPNFKATFKIHLLKPKEPNYIALSNYPQISEEEHDNGILVNFAETVPMSTYLTCFIVCDFVYSETYFQNDHKKIPFRVYASPGQLEKTEYAGFVGAQVIEYYVKYFNIPYPLPKLDMIAIPDFISSAMEHWGLVTFRETALLYTNTTHSSHNKQRVAMVIAHELAHSWFGNLVTMNWWNDLWLNEGFASYIEYKGVDNVEPTWKILDQFLIMDLHLALSIDSTLSSHPIIQTVSTPDQITEVFDLISYKKGAAILRMLESVVGEENFRNGVTNYLNKFKYRNAITQDLWNELQAVVGNTLNITEFMGTFTIQMGYPILDVTIDGDKYVIKQSRFLKDPELSTNLDESPIKYKWSIPINYVTDQGKSEITWFNYKDYKVTIEKPSDAKWLKFNPEQICYYRVNYPETEWEILIENIKNLSISDRTHLLEESFSIAQSGALDYKVPLNLTKYLIDEYDYVPWSIASSNLLFIKNYLQNSIYEVKLENYIIKLLKPVYEKLSWNESKNDSHLKRLVRIEILNLACEVGYQDALMFANEKFLDWINDKVILSQDLRAIIYKYGMININETIWLKFFDKFTNETDASEKIKLMRGLAYVQEPALITKLIDLAKDETYIRAQDYFILMQYLADNPIGLPIVWDYVRENWEDLVRRFTLNDRYLGSLIPNITKKFLTNTKLEEMRQFFKKYPEAGAGTIARKQALENVNYNIKWLAKYKETVENWLDTNPN